MKIPFNEWRFFTFKAVVMRKDGMCQVDVSVNAGHISSIEAFSEGVTQVRMLNGDEYVIALPIALVERQAADVFRFNASLVMSN
jgi:uncharacterized protein YlzI (FlbEa/FlbD family)